jgi:hypothetical protein
VHRERLERRERMEDGGWKRKRKRKRGFGIRQAGRRGRG